MSGGRSFFDTNVLIYAYSEADPERHARAVALYEEHLTAGTMLISTQVVQEFYAAASRKLKFPHETARWMARALLELPLMTVTADLIRAALEIEARYEISFWDSLILAAADAGGADVIYTEDLNHGQLYGRVMALNPFRLPLPKESEASV
jgi:predicted nucleic acid-binding protein